MTDVRNQEPVKFMAPGSSFSLKLHFSFQERTVEMRDEIKFSLMNSDQ